MHRVDEQRGLSPGLGPPLRLFFSCPERSPWSRPRLGTPLHRLMPYPPRPGIRPFTLVWSFRSGNTSLRALRPRSTSSPARWQSFTACRPFYGGTQGKEDPAGISSSSSRGKTSGADWKAPTVRNISPTSQPGSCLSQRQPFPMLCDVPAPSQTSLNNSNRNSRIPRIPLVCGTMEHLLPPQVQTLPSDYIRYSGPAAVP